MTTDSPIWHQATRAAMREAGCVQRNDGLPDYGDCLVHIRYDLAQSWDEDRDVCTEVDRIVRLAWETAIRVALKWTITLEQDALIAALLPSEDAR